MRNLQKRKMISVLLAVVLLLCAAFPVSAQTTSETPSSATQLTDEDLLIPEDVAEYIAEYFVDDMAATGMTVWDENTAITDCVTTYDETGEAITSYTFELTSGYVTVAAYADMPSPILEWADEAEPVYAEFDSLAGAKVIYTGPMDYYLDDGGSTLETLEGTQVTRAQISDNVSILRDEEHIQPEIKKDLVQAKEYNVELAKQTSQPNFDLARRPPNNHEGGYITSADIYLENTEVLAGKWVCTDWANYWEDYATFTLQSNFSDPNHNCGPIAITNAILMYGKKRNISSIKNDGARGVYESVMDANDAVASYYYRPGYGTESGSAYAFIEDSFAQYGQNVTMYGPYDLTVSDIQNVCTNNRLMYIMLVNDEIYADHHLIGYAWSCMADEYRPYREMYFIKVADGHNSSGRYLDQRLVEDDTFWEIYFPNLSEF